MKKQIISGFFIAQGVIFAFSLSTASAATTLPPGNPFYFVQDSVRSLRRAFTFSTVSKALLELRMVSERRMDIGEVLTAGKEDEIVLTAFSAYDNEVNSLAEYAVGISDDRVLQGVAGIFMRHSRFLGDAFFDTDGIRSVEVRGAILASRDNLNRLVVEVFGENGYGEFRSRAEDAVVQDSDPYRELYALDALYSLSQQVSSPRMARELALFKDDMAITLVGKLKRSAITAEKISSLTGDPLMRLYSINAMRDRAGDVETKNILTLASRNISQKAIEERLMTAREARSALAYAALIMGIPEAKNDQSDYFVQQADKFMSDSVYDLAFQHGVLASGAATESLLVNTLSAQDLRDEITLVKRQYDAVRVKPAFIDKRIAAIADVIGKVSTRNTLTAIREVKLVLALLGN